MISSIRGKLIEKTTSLVIIEINGIGFEVHIPLSTYEALGETGSDISILTYLHVREDVLVLFGFGTREERNLFRELLNVSGIGPKLALVIISAYPIPQFYGFVAESDEVALLRISGLGKKTVQRLIIDMKDRAVRYLNQAGVETTPRQTISQDKLEGAIRALIALGYSRTEAEQAIVKANVEAGEEISIEELIKKALHQ
jgi:Holliday junction DNA helicase RuvA